MKTISLDLRRNEMAEEVDEDLVTEMMILFIDCVQKALKKMPSEKRETINEMMDKKIERLMEK